jgi:hypothetical protein
VWVDRRRRDQTVTIVASRVLVLDLPMVVVHEHVVMSAKQYAAIQIGSPSVSMPVVDVMSLAPTRWSVTTREPASTIASGKCDSLPRGEQSLLATDV